MLRDLLLFDIYRPKATVDAQPQTGEPPPQKSMALRLTLNSPDATLSEAQIEGVVQAVLATLAQKLGARQRA